MVPRERVGLGRALLQWRHTECLLCAFAILEAVGALALMFYALVSEAGNLVDLPHKRIGFFNFCLWNETAGERQCLQINHLQAMGVGLLGIILARLCVYICLVFSLFYFIVFASLRCTDKVECSKVILIILIIKMMLLSGGLGIFLLQTSQWIHPSDFTGGFWALVGAQALILLQILTVTGLHSWAKQEALPIKI